MPKYNREQYKNKLNEIAKTRTKLDELLLTLASKETDEEKRVVAQQILSEYCDAAINQMDTYASTPDSLEQGDILDWYGNTFIAFMLLNDKNLKEAASEEYKESFFDKYASLNARIGSNYLVIHEAYEKLSHGEIDKRMNEDGSLIDEFDPQFRMTEVFAETITKAKEAHDRRNDDKELAKLGKKLEDAKTFVNSSEYKDIIKMVKAFDSQTKVPHTDSLKENEVQALKLKAIKNKVDEYIAHKAKDGVKQNVYKKLAAVEELNKYLCKRINKLAPEHFYIGDKKYFLPENVHENFLDGIENPQLKDKLDFEKQNGTFQEKYDAIKGQYNTSLDEYKNVQDCMGRIILSANQKAINTKDLSKQQLDFMTKPSTTGEPNKVQEKVAGGLGK